MNDTKTPFEIAAEYEYPYIQNGKAENIESFYKQVIAPQFKNIEAIKRIHNAIMDYVQRSKNPIFFIRLYGSASKNKYTDLRRGFVSVYKDGTKFAFCDNEFAKIFAAIKESGDGYDEKDLKEYLSKDNLTCGFSTTNEERKQSYYIANGALRCKITARHWYLAHIKPVGKDYNGDSIAKFFPRHEYADWDNKDKIRYINQCLCDKVRKYLVAAFVRLIHPFNSFLLPNNNHIDYVGKRLGEEEGLIDYVQQKIKKLFPKEFKEFDEITFPLKSKFKIKEVGEIIWKENLIRKRKTFNPVSVSKKKTKTINFLKDEVANNDSEVLERSLQSIGKETFLFLYEELKYNKDVKIEKLVEKPSKYARYSANSMSSRLSKSRSIIYKKNEALPALEMIAESSCLCDKVKAKAKELIKKDFKRTN